MIPFLRAILLAVLSLLLLAAFACGDKELDDSLTRLEVGDCMSLPGGDVTEVESLTEVDCSDADAIEVVDVFDVSRDGDAYPGQDEIDRQIAEECPETTTFTLFPTQESWEQAGDRSVACFATR